MRQDRRSDALCRLIRAALSGSVRLGDATVDLSVLWVVDAILAEVLSPAAKWEIREVAVAIADDESAIEAIRKWVQTGAE